MSATQVRLIRLALIVAAARDLGTLCALRQHVVADRGPERRRAGVVAEGAWASRGVRAAVGVTLVELVVAFALSVVFGMLIGVLIGLSNIGRRSLYPVVLLLYGIPQAIMLPLFVLIFGLGPASKIAFGFSHGIFPVIVNTHRRHAQRQPAAGRRRRRHGRDAGAAGALRDLPAHGDDGVRRPAAGHDADAARRRPGGDLRVAGRHRLLHAGSIPRPSTRRL